MSTLIAPQTRNGDRAGERVWRTELSPVSFLRRAAEVHADTPALVHGARRMSYRQLNERVARLASALRALGIDDGDRVAVLAPNTPAMVEAHFAVPAAGGLLVCINIRQSPGEVARLLEHAEPKVILVDREFEGLLSSFDTASVEVIRIADSGAPDDPYEQFVAWPEIGRPHPHELQLALVVASGATNREAGARLFLSPKTIEAHLGRIYRKLGVRSRTELAALVVHEGLGADITLGAAALS